LIDSEGAITIFILILSLLVVLFLLIKLISKKIVTDEINLWGAQGRMAGLYAYRKYGIWHLGYLKKGK